MYKPKTIEKVYWKVGEVSQMLDISPPTIRFYCKEFGIIPKRSRGDNERRFIKFEVELLRKIKFMLREGFTLKGIKKNMEKYQANEQGIIERIAI